MIARLTQRQSGLVLTLLASFVISLVASPAWFPTNASVAAAASAHAQERRERHRERREERQAEKERGPRRERKEDEERSKLFELDYPSSGSASLRYDSPAEAAQFFKLKRLPEGAKELPLEKYEDAYTQMRRMPVFATATEQFLTEGSAVTAPLHRSAAEPAQLNQPTWNPLGPGNIGGRTRGLVINPQDPNVMFAAGVSGGLWKTTNGGQAWAPIGDRLANLTVSALLLDPTNANVIYVGTGEGVSVFTEDTQGDFRGAGIFKSTDGGATFSQLEGTRNENFYFVNDLVISPASNQRLYAATRAGVYRSLDGGGTWTRVLNPLNVDGDPVTGGCFDLAMRTDKLDADVVFAACGSFEDAAIYRTKNGAGADAWSQVFTEAGMGRTALALAPSNQDIIYAISSEVEDRTFVNQLHAVFRSTSGGDASTWTARVRNTSANKLNRSILSFAIDSFATDCGYALQDGYFGQAWYDLVLAVDPVDSNRVWAGGVDFFRSDDGGANWGLATQAYQDPANAQYLHPDQHLLVFHPQYNGTTNQVLFVGNDGGLWRTENARAGVATGPTAPCQASNTAVTWRSLNNGYGVTQFYHGTVTPDGKSYFGGTQDNGTVLGTDQQGGNAWREIFGGDGGYVAIDVNRPATLYAESTGYSLNKSTDGGATFGSALFGISGDSGQFITPYVIDPSDPNRLWTGGAFIWRTTSAASLWTRASNIAPGNGDVSALAVSPTDANYVLVGLSDGFIARTANGLTTNAATNWASTQPQRGYVSWLTFDPNNKNIAYATFSTFGSGHVYRSQDAGATWTAIDGTGTGALPDVPVHCLVIDPNNTARLYIGTDVGVFVTNDGGANWAVENTGFPNVITESLTLQVVNGETWLYAFTHGRGAWRVRLNGNGCNYGILPATVSVGVSGATGQVNVSAQPGGCNWTATSNAVWLQVTGSGSASGTVSYTASANTSITARTATATIAGRSFVITQPGVPDLTPPTIAVTDPNPNTTANDILGSIPVRGTASDNGALSAITWSNNRGGSGLATGTTAWTISALPLASGLNTITVTATDTAGNVARASFNVNSRPASLILSIIGNGLSAPAGDGGLATLAQIGQPSALAYDALGNLYIAETFNDRIRKVNASDGKISTVAGGAGNGYAGDGGPATAARLNCPTGVAVDAQGNIYIADRDNHRIRRVAAADGLITTFAGTGTPGSNGDNGDAKLAQLFSPFRVLVDKQGNLLIADTDNHRIRKVTSDGKITTIAGTGVLGVAGDGGPATSAQLNGPEGMALDADGNLFIADTENHRIRRLNASNGILTTIAGTGVRGATGDGGDAVAARIGLPEGVWVDAQKNIFIADTFNDRIRRINASDGKISTVAGNGLNGYSGDGTSATGTRLNCPTEIITDAAGRLLIADRDNHRVRSVQTVPAGDTTAPTIALTAPTTNPTFTTNISPLTLNGTATDANGVVQVQWVNDRGFSGTAAGTNAWAALNIPLLLGANNLTVTAFDISGNASSVQLAVTFNPQQLVSTLAGNGTFGGAGDGGAAVAAQLWSPRAVAVDGQGNVYVADTQNHRIRKIAPSGVITAFAGTGILGSSGDGGPATEATLNEPRSVIADSAGNVYIGDYRNHRVRKVTPDGKISTIAGTGVEGDAGDGGPATQAQMSTPLGLALDTQGNLYIAETGGNRVRKVNAGDGKISTVAGTGDVGFSGDGGPATAARFDFLSGLAVDRQGNLYIVDQGNYRLRKVNASDGRISTIAGTGIAGYNGDDIPASTARLNETRLLTLDNAGDLLLADQGNNRIRKITLATGVITTVAGSGVGGFSGDNGAPTAAMLSFPTGIAVDAQGNMFIADGGNHRIRKVQAASNVRTVASISAASFTTALASEALAAAFGVNLATTTQAATSVPLPTVLAGTSLRVRDSQGVERFAPLFFVSPGQVNYQVPAGTANGLATVTVNTGDGGLLTGTVSVNTLAPGLFSANSDGQGVPAGIAVRVKTSGEQTFELISRLEGNRFVPTPIDLGPDGEQVILVLFGTGYRNRNAGGTVSVRIGGVDAEVLFAGQQGDLVGVDQLNVRLPRTLAGRGEVDLVLTVDGRPANTVRVNVK
ncbi:MAG: hypothetical protein HYR56_26285 [Acidobacteria bacterium]|nr:hypothetical protein [Acidobacteriota bacterium]MBI3422584.1 hypothetical protein [Acidobacteriota bacterium]